MANKIIMRYIDREEGICVLALQRKDNSVVGHQLSKMFEEVAGKLTLGTSYLYLQLGRYVPESIPTENLQHLLEKWPNLVILDELEEGE